MEDGEEEGETVAESDEGRRHCGSVVQPTTPYQHKLVYNCFLADTHADAARTFICVRRVAVTALCSP